MEKLFIILILRSNYRFHNIINLIRNEGTLISWNGFKFPFDKDNKKDIRRIYLFSNRYGVEFSDTNRNWNYKEGIITTPSGIKFLIKKFDPLIFSETFLSDIHFSSFDLVNKVVIQAGGFIGDTALYYASRGAKIYSFEPDINSYNTAMKNIKLNPELSKVIVMKNYALGEDGEIDFPINPNGSGGSSASSINNKRTIKVKSISVNGILNEFSLKDPFLLDIDIKGNEFELIKDKAISLFQMVRVEYSTSIDGKMIGNRNTIINKLKEMGFKKIRVYKHNEGTYDLMAHGTIEASR